MCGICGKFSPNYLCQKCYLLLKKQAKFIIEKKQEDENYFENHLYIFQYQGIIRRAILNYKFKEESYLYLTFVNFLLKNDFFFENFKSYDTIIPVPISKKRKKERGYNQSLLIAKELVKQINQEKKTLNLCTDALEKIKNIVPQSTLDKENRLKNIQGVYKLKNKEQLENKKILLIDDIYTTGNTVNEASRILNQANVKEVNVLVLAKD